MDYQVPEKSEMSRTERLYFPEIIRGVAITAAHFLRNIFGRRDPRREILERQGVSQVTTIQYPEERIVYPPGYRGLHRLVPRDDGRPRCVACYMCATICPAQCIFIEAGEYPVDDTKENAVIEKYPVQFVIDELRCIVCGFCVEACPKDAIRMDTGLHTPSGYDRDAFIFDLAKLLKGPAVSHPSDPWNKRTTSEAPEQHQEAHTGVGDESARQP
jgi:NADH-quinone oxidoreductase subunit I